MQIQTPSPTLTHPNQALLFEQDGRSAVCRQLKGRRGKQGRQDPLAEILPIGILAQLTGQTSSRAMAGWAKMRSQDVQPFFHLRHAKMPHARTWSRIMGQAIDPDELAQVPGRGTQPGEYHRCADGNTLKGTIPLGKSQGVHLLAASLPHEGVVLAQIPVKTIGNELSEALPLLATLDVRGIVRSGNATLAASALSQMIRKTKGDALWVSKENRSQRSQDRHPLFEPQPNRPGWSAPPMDVRQTTAEDHGYGRWKTRQITVSRLLAGDRLWPGLSHVLTLERQRSHTPGGTGARNGGWHHPCAHLNRNSSAPSRPGSRTLAG